MPVLVEEHTLELTMPDMCASVDPASPSYPGAEWRVQPGTGQKVPVEAVSVENSYIRATLLPRFGPWLWSLIDKRDERSLLDRSTELHTRPTERGYLAWKGGLWVTEGRTRPGLGLYSVSHHIDRSGLDDGRATVWVRSDLGRTGVNLHVGFTVLDGHAGVQTDIRVHNRGLLPAPFQVITHLECAAAGSRVFWPAPRLMSHNVTLADEALGLQHSAAVTASEPAPWFAILESASGCGLARCADAAATPYQAMSTHVGGQDSWVTAAFGVAEAVMIGPHRLETWRELWLPIRALPSISAVGEQGAISLLQVGDKWEVRMCAAMCLVDHRLVVRPDGHAPQALRVDLYPEAPFSVTLGRLPDAPFSVTLETMNGHALLTASSEGYGEPVVECISCASEPATAGEWVRRGEQLEARGENAYSAYTAARALDPANDCALNGLARAALRALQSPNIIGRNADGLYVSSVEAVLSGDDPTTTLHAALRDPRWTNASYFLLGILESRRGRFETALGYFEEALYSNGADTLSWLMRSACLRKLRRDEEAADERVSVHVLTPLEPVLRAEAFLSQLDDAPDDAARVLAPFDGLPAPFLDAAEFYLHAGMLDDAVAILSEAIRHCPDEPMFHLLEAHCAMQNATMAPFASEKIAQAARVGLNASAPHRHCEKLALDAAREARPDYALVNALLERLLTSRRTR